MAFTGGLVRFFKATWLIALAGTIVFFYWPTLMTLVHQWATVPDFSHGFLIPIFALYLLWRRRHDAAELRCQFSGLGLVLLTLAGLARLASAYVYLDWLDAFSFVLALAGVAALWGGWPALRWCGPAVAFLLFMIPLPYRLQMALGSPLQRAATQFSTYTLQTLGFPALAEGNVILLDHVQLGIIDACNGLGMMVAFFALSTAVAYLIDRPLWEKLVIVVSAVPIAILANVARITVTGALYELANRELADLVFHDLAGWLMMPLALAMLALEVQFFARALASPPKRAAEPKTQFNQFKAAHAPAAHAPVGKVTPKLVN